MQDPFISLKCPFCGSNLQKDEKRNILICPACGSEHFLKENVGSLTPPVRENINACPRCKRNDRVIKVTAILRNQERHGSQMSSLAQKLRMPSPPSEPIGSGGLMLVSFYAISSGFLIFLTIILINVELNFARVSCLVLVLAIFIALSIVLTKKDKKQRQEIALAKLNYKENTLPKWERAQARWNKAYYCTRDDYVFINDENVLVAPELFSSWLIETTR